MVSSWMIRLFGHVSDTAHDLELEQGHAMVELTTKNLQSRHLVQSGDAHKPGVAVRYNDQDTYL